MSTRRNRGRRTGGRSKGSATPNRDRNIAEWRAAKALTAELEADYAGQLGRDGETSAQVEHWQYERDRKKAGRDELLARGGIALDGSPLEVHPVTVRFLSPGELAERRGAA